MKTHQKCVASLGLALFAATLWPVVKATVYEAPEGSEWARDSIQIHFRQSKIELDPDYMGNRHQLEEVSQRIRKMGAPGSKFELQSVEVAGAASPEGPVEFNKWLSENRAATIFDHLKKYVDMPDSLTEFEYSGRDWEGLLRLAQGDTALPCREETLGLLAEIAKQKAESGETETDGFLNRVKKFKGGAPYRYMYRNLFPTLRQSYVVLNYFRPAEPGVEEMVTETVEAVPETIYVTLRDTVYVEYCPPCKPFYMDVRTNLLYDAACIPNIGVEFYLGKGWSVGANWQYAWWSKDTKHRFWRAYGGDVNVRKWFGSQSALKPLSGHHLGVYGQVLTFDFEFGGKGYMGGLPGKSLWQRCNWGGGLEYGYSLPVASRLNLDFTIGVGAFGGRLYEYTPDGSEYIWTKTKNYTWWGPTKAEISLAWMIGCNNRNVKLSKKTKEILKAEGQEGGVK